KVNETLPFDTARVARNPDDLDTDHYFSYEEDLQHRITRVVSGDRTDVSVPGATFFSSLAPAEMRNIFSGVQVDLDYNIANRHSVVDDFSDTRLIDEELF
ncbi:hypothetical protein ACFL2W_00765, partial [Candidatus Omnitrophota bacterium]